MSQLFQRKGKEWLILESCNLESLSDLVHQADCIRHLGALRNPQLISKPKVVSQSHWSRCSMTNVLSRREPVRINAGVAADQAVVDDQVPGECQRSKNSRKADFLDSFNR